MNIKRWPTIKKKIGVNKNKMIITYLITGIIIGIILYLTKDFLILIIRTIIEMMISFIIILLTELFEGEK